MTTLLVVGSDFTPGASANSQVAEMVYGDLLSEFGSTLRRNEEGEFVPIPDYCNDAQACASLLNARGVTPVLLPAAGDKPRWVAIFELDGELASTTPFNKQSQAIACATHAVLMAETTKSALT